MEKVAAKVCENLPIDSTTAEPKAELVVRRICRRSLQAYAHYLQRRTAPEFPGQVESTFGRNKRQLLLASMSFSFFSFLSCVLPLKKLSGIASTTFQPKNKNKIPMKFEYYERKLRLSNRSWQRETTFC
jgi:hypothetical protein